MSFPSLEKLEVEGSAKYVMKVIEMWPERQRSSGIMTRGPLSTLDYFFSSSNAHAFTTSDKVLGAIAVTFW